MTRYCLGEHLEKVYSCFSVYRSRPVIGMTTNHHDCDAVIRDRYYMQVVAAGGVPLLLPPVDDAGVLLSYADLIDALLLTGGGDCDPRWMNEEPSALLGDVNETRDLPELLIARLAFNRQMPILGICRGMQMMAIAFGGHVAQDISIDPLWNCREKIVHSQTEPRNVKTHSVLFDKGSVLCKAYNKNNIEVNSFHHQVVDVVPKGFRAAAWSADGIIEAIESEEHKPVLGVQWHPEWLSEEGKPVFEWLVGEAGIYKKAKALHKKIVVADSHCDTPMFFTCGADFTKRDSKIKVDLVKMTEGMTDVATMAAYVPQPLEGQTWKDVSPDGSDTPFVYVNRIFDKIEALAATSMIPVAVARNPDEVLSNKQNGIKSIMLAVENALAIGNDLSRVEHLKKRGAIYLTLCHNGDNQICDSARKSSNTWRGLSPFGKDTVREMNRQGVMIDLSHAAERSFYDVIELSEKPVVCSHSNCKAVCSSERNISDDQLRALAEHDGVCQLTLYEGFVSDNPKQADIICFIEHVKHAARIAGVEHIGIGSDFDGDGGIVGLNDASEMILFTRQLLTEHFSDEDIRLILGGNWLRVLGENRRKTM